MNTKNKEISSLSSANSLLRMPGSGLALKIYELANEHQFTIIVTSSDRETNQIADEISFFKGNTSDILTLPSWECLPYDHFSPHPEIISKRLVALKRLCDSFTGILIIGSEQLAFRLPPKSFIEASSFDFSVRDKLDQQGFRSRLYDAGYVPVSNVLSQGEFAIRGGLIDIFPIGAQDPFRLDLFGDEIECIRVFDAATQKTVTKTDHIRILPAREFPSDSRAIKNFRSGYRKYFSGEPTSSLIYQEVSQQRFPAGIEYYFPLFFDKTSSIFDYIPSNSAFFVPDNIIDNIREQKSVFDDRFTLCQSSERQVLPPNMLLISPEVVSQSLLKFNSITYQSSLSAISPSTEIKTPPRYTVDHRSTEPFSILLKRLRKKTCLRVLICVETEGRLENLLDLIKNNNIDIKIYKSWLAFTSDSSVQVGITVCTLDRGLISVENNLEVIVESQMYGQRVRQRANKQISIEPEAVIKSIAELHQGDPVVHIEHGIGRYCGLENIGIDGNEMEFVAVKYRDNGKLYVPVINIASLSRYIGGSPESAPLHKLGGSQWQKSQERVKAKAYDAAAELLKTEALRQLRSGYSFKLDQATYDTFSLGFPYEVTPDQQIAINDVIEDLCSPNPMDRLVCGDVGFGKTEVALRAAFIVASNKKQVAVLTPTTLLAKQHFETFSERFADFDIPIENLSRFQSKNQINETLKTLESGRPCIVIGTHRILQADLTFSNLGLMIIDEEHRFGVRQKEVLKKTREHVDILTLTATPIPRTLNIAISGFRSISLIGSAPPGRVSIKTGFHNYSENLIRDACLREINRGGQIYFLHNEVKNITSVSIMLERLVPEGRLAIAHGQMRERELETVMRDFHNQKYNILLCTTIIESGIDIPLANTIIINNAENFGLAQLHQLRGRVGRSNRQAFAFLLTSSIGSLKQNAKKRLNAISELTELGSGFILANNDLEIRGAGELLGEQQSGAIEEAGFSLYAEYLNRAIRDLSNSKVKSNLIDSNNTLPNIELGVGAFFPHSFIPDVHTRLILYQRLAGLRSLEQIHDLRLEVLDRFGRIPIEGQTLFRLSFLKLEGRWLGLSKIDSNKTRGRIVFLKEANISPDRMIYILHNYHTIFSMKSDLELSIKINIDDSGDRITFFEWIVNTLNIEKPIDNIPVMDK